VGRCWAWGEGMRKGRGLPTGRGELLAWANTFAGADYARVEHCADGVVYAHVADAAHEGRFPLQRLNFAARNEEECARNLLVVQQEFKKLRINHLVPVDRLSRGRFQDNNDFMQWCYAYLASSGDVAVGYDAVRRREEALAKQQRTRQLGRATLPPPVVKPELAESQPPPPDADLSRGLDASGGGRHYDPSAYAPAAENGGGTGATVEGGGEDARAQEFYALSTALCGELRAQREVQLKKRRQLAELEKERNDLWQQLRTVEELLSSFSGIKSTELVADILFEGDPRLAC